MCLTLLPEIIFPVAYLKIHKEMERREGLSDKKAM